MSSTIQRIVHLAKNAVSTAFVRSCAVELDDQLLKALNSLTVNELYFDPNEPFDTHKGLPAYYVDIYEDKNLSIGIFFLNAATKIPLHDHPRMTGIIKCIDGNLKVSSFSPVQQTSEEKLILAVPHEDINLSPSSDPKMLTPNSHNIHEVKNASSSAPAAFLDILTPPYNIPELPDFSPNEDVRLCNYYEIVGSEICKELSKECVSLRIIDKPKEFIDRSYKY